MLFTDNRSGINFSKDPAVIRFGGQYFLYYTAWPTKEEKAKGVSLMIGIARSGDLENWQKVGDFELTQECEKNGVGAPAAIVLDGKVHLFYQTYGNGKRDAICHAVSDDGVRFAKDETNPVFRPTDDWCCGRAIDADVCEFHGKLFLYFATRDHEYRVQKLGVAAADMESGFGRNDWKQLVNQSVLAPEMKWEMECIEAPATIAQNGKIYLFYGGAYNCKPQQVGCAVSGDGVFFERVSNRPLLAPGEPGSWNSSESGHPYAFRDDDGEAYLFYQGSPDGGQTWYLSRAKIEFDGDTPRILA